MAGAQFFDIVGGALPMVIIAAVVETMAHW